MTTELHRKYDLRLPRYTSYPTAPHFSTAVSPATFRGWLEALDPDLPVSVYLHVPYCEEMCWFCGCNTKITRQYAPVARFTDMLLDEIALLERALARRPRATHVHFGGGSPTILKPEDLRRVMAALGRVFDIAPEAEIAIEMDPRTATPAFMDAMAETGFTRSSIGVQDFDPTVQRAVNRIQDYALVKQVVDGLRARGMTGINLDLMYGLPYQSVETLIDTVDRAVTLHPDRLAIFGYAHVPWMKKHQRLINEAALPDPATRWSQYEAIQERLHHHDYVAIGLDHFAHRDDAMARALAAGELHRNFQGYTTDTAPALIGVGPSAISALPQGYAQNDPALNLWRDAIAAGSLATEKGIAVTAEDRLRRDIINTLMCAMSVDLDLICADHGQSADRFAPELARIGAMATDGIVTVAGNRITMTESGRALVRAVAAVFDTYLDGGAGRHSQAV